MHRRFRLTQTTDFQRVRQLGKSMPHPLFVLLSLANDSASTRVGIVAGKKVGMAVQRNRAKRRLRSAVNTVLTHIKPGWDIILIARPPLLYSPWEAVLAALQQTLKRARLWIEPSND